MIYITQGHEKSIAIEVLVKGLFMLPIGELHKLKYIVHQETLESNLIELKINYHINKNQLVFENNRKINCIFLDSSIEKSSFDSIIYCLKNATKDDIFITSPTSKDKFYWLQKNYLGHTDFFRSYYKKNLTMNFVNNNEQVLILTDHVPVSEITKNINTNNIYQQIVTSINGLKKYFNRDILKVLVSGINPHAGEKGLIGTEDFLINKALIKLRNSHPNIDFIGPIPADTLSNQVKESYSTLQVFCHHDQALTYFKHKNGFLGINTTFGGECLRLSVDHGTASELYGLNKANPLGSYFVLNKALKIHDNIRS